MFDNTRLKNLAVNDSASIADEFKKGRKITYVYYIGNDDRNTNILIGFDASDNPIWDAVNVPEGKPRPGFTSVDEALAFLRECENMNPTTTYLTSIKWRCKGKRNARGGWDMAHTALEYVPWKIIGQFADAVSA